MSNVDNRNKLIPEQKLRPKSHQIHDSKFFSALRTKLLDIIFSSTRDKYISLRSSSSAPHGAQPSQKPACRFPARASSAVDSQYGVCYPLKSCLHGWFIPFL